MQVLFLFSDMLCTCRVQNTNILLACRAHGRVAGRGRAGLASTEQLALEKIVPGTLQGSGDTF